MHTLCLKRFKASKLEQETIYFSYFAVDYNFSFKMEGGLPETNYVPYYVKKEKRWKSWRGNIRFYFDG